MSGCFDLFHHRAIRCVIFVYFLARPDAPSMLDIELRAWTTRHWNIHRVDQSIVHYLCP